MEANMTLKNLKPGQCAFVTSISGERAIRRRLIDMGITPGVKITMKRTAPLGDPMEINLRGYDLSLRKAEASRITLEKSL
jgi:ferrous iron transport protein A